MYIYTFNETITTNTNSLSEVKLRFEAYIESYPNVDAWLEEHKGVIDTWFVAEPNNKWRVAILSMDELTEAAPFFTLSDTLPTSPYLVRQTPELPNDAERYAIQMRRDGKTSYFKLFDLVAPNVNVEDYLAAGVSIFNRKEAYDIAMSRHYAYAKRCAEIGAHILMHKDNRYNDELIRTREEAEFWLKKATYVSMCVSEMFCANVDNIEPIQRTMAVLVTPVVLPTRKIEWYTTPYKAPAIVLSPNFCKTNVNVLTANKAGGKYISNRGVWEGPDGRLYSQRLEGYSCKICGAFYTDESKYCPSCRKE